MWPASPALSRPEPIKLTVPAGRWPGGVPHSRTREDGTGADDAHSPPGLKLRPCLSAERSDRGFPGAVTGTRARLLERRDGTALVCERLARVEPPSIPRAGPGTPGSVVIWGAERPAMPPPRPSARRLSGRLTMLSADQSVPCDRPNLSKGFLAGRVAQWCVREPNHR